MDQSFPELPLVQLLKNSTHTPNLFSNDLDCFTGKFIGTVPVASSVGIGVTLESSVLKKRERSEGAVRGVALSGAAELQQERPRP